MKRRFALLTAFLLLLGAPFLALAQNISPGQGVSFAQVDFPAAGLTNSAVGMASVNLIKLRNATGRKSGYINVSRDNSWVVRNLPVFSESDFPYSHLSSYFDLGVTQGTDVTSLALGVVYTAEVQTSMPSSQSISFTVGSMNISAGGMGEGGGRNAGGPTQPPTMNDVLFGDPANTRAIFQLDHPNIEAADNQCYPMAVANSLQFLEDTPDLEIPHEHKAGLKGDDSLVGQIGSYMGRTVISRQAQPEGAPQNSGVDDMPGIRGKLKYLAANGLSERVQTRHWGLYAGDNSAVETVGDASAHSAAQSQQIDFASIVSALEGGEDCEAAYTYTVSGGGHAVDLVAAGYTNGQPWIIEGSDVDQDSDTEGAGPTGFIFSHLTDNNNDGYPELGGGEQRLDLVICQKYIPPTTSTGTFLPPPDTALLIPGAGLVVDGVQDPAGHSCCVDSPPSTIDLSFDNGKLQLSGSGASWLPMTLNIGGSGGLSGTNQATVAEISSVSNSITGTMNASGIDAKITLGTQGELYGTPISFDVTITPPQAWPWSVATAPASLATAIRANGFRHQLSLASGDPLSIALSLTQGSSSGNADWWLAAQAGGQYFSYDIASGGWVPGLVPVYQGPLFDLGNTPLISMPGGLPSGDYTIYFGVDLSANGELDVDSLRYDSVTVSVMP